MKRLFFLEALLQIFQVKIPEKKGFTKNLTDDVSIKTFYMEALNPSDTRANAGSISAFKRLSLREYLKKSPERIRELRDHDER
jgi:hypothetical protein